MKNRIRRKIFKGAAAVLACAAAAGIFLQTTAVTVQAAANSLPGIDIIVNGNSSEKPFRILELVDDSEKAEIGYYVSGQEPTVKLYTYTDAEGNTIHFSTFEEGLSQLPEKQRKEFVMNVKVKDDGSIDTVSSTGISRVEMKQTTETEAPLSYKDYQEKYFLDSSDNEDEWNKVDLKDNEGNSRTDIVQVNGSYAENQDGTGDYTKEEQQYYPIRGDVETDRSGAELFRENIQSFSYVEDEDTHGAYFLQFAEVDNDTVNAAFGNGEDAQSALENIQSEYDYTNGRYGYYENVYTDLTEDIVTNINNEKYTFPGEKPDDSAIEGSNSNAVSVQNNDIQSADVRDRQILGEISDNATAGEQANPYIYLGETIEEYPYYKYTLVGDLKYVQEKAAETHTEGYNNGDIILEDGQYWYLVEEENRFVQTELSIVTGRQQVAYEDIAGIPTDFDYNYYYVVDQVWFCSEKSDGGSDANPSDYQFFGWYYPIYPGGEDIYLPVSEGEIPTYYISEAQYTLTPGIGNYDFVPGSGDDTQLVQVNQLYYQGGYENHDWLKKYVFHLEKDTYDGFNVQVDTRYADDARIPVYAGVKENTDDAVETDVTSYDLIYVNGELSESVASEITDSGVPCIINMNHADNNALRTAFASYIRENDGDGNYVKQKMYFFKDTDTAGGSFVNNNFAKAFDATQTEGFEEITKYIEQENKYRDLGEDGTKLDQLSDEISPARAVEYIINYQYKRKSVSKGEINVLEIMPDKDCKDYDNLEGQVKAWIGIDNANVKVTDVCCHQSGYGKEGINDGNTSTYWHSVWNTSEIPHKNSPHWIEIELDEPEDIKGFTYQPRNNDNINGILSEWTVECYDEDDNLIGDAIDSTDKTKCKSSNSDRSLQKIYFTEDGEVIQNVKKMKLYFKSALRNDSSANMDFAVCDNIGVMPAQEVTVTSMTASEFVGHIDDIASEYDMIYIDGTKKQNSESLITGEGELRYSHVGSGKQIQSGENNDVEGLVKLLGQLDTEYLWNSDGSHTTKNGKILFAPINTYGEDSGGYYRGSGNDMTSNQCNELLDFVKSGYPVIVGAELISDGTVNKQRVDDSSWYYQFLSEAISYQNVMTDKDLNSGKGSIAFFANLVKPTITFSEKPDESPRAGESNVQGSGYINGELKYVFSIGNDSDVDPASTTYDCKLYIDLNFDGNLSSKESQDQYIVIQDEDGEVISQVSYGEDDKRYELQAGKSYTLTRKIPDDYFKLITWKLEVSSNKNYYIHTSEMGYAKQKNTGEKQVIKVLQLLPRQSNNTPKTKGGTWVLSDKYGLDDDSKAGYNKFKTLVSQIEDFDIQVDAIWVKNPDGSSKGDINSMEEGEMKELLSNYQMLVIGFNDVYEDISNENHQVDDILDFIKSGKSVLFSHDTTSYINYDKDKVYNKIADTTYGKDENTSIYSDGWLFNTAKNPTWGLSLNTVLRSVVGMDRYGITSDEEWNGTSVSSILKKGQALNNQSVNFSELMQLAGDVAWKTNSDRSSSYAQTQAYSNHMLNRTRLGSNLVTTAKKINDGAITEYPYRMSDLEDSSGNLTISKTHGQYYQLGLEQDRDINGNSDGESDIVVWYCLSGSIYNNSPNDARNNYYFYSKGNVIYTGAGHSSVNQDSEIKLFINAMVAAANVTAVDPEVNFVEELNPTANIESTRYYSTDQSSWTDDEANVLEQSMDFYVNVKDYNMVSADLNQADLDKQEMTLEFFIDSDGGEYQEGGDGSSKMTNITEVIGSLKGYDGTIAEIGSDGVFHLTQNTAYQLTLSGLEQYLRTTGSATSSDQNGYRKDCKLHVKVTSTVYLYGEPKTSTQWASIDLKQRQLFELN